MVVNPLTVRPETPLRQALDLMQRHGISGLPVVEGPSGRLVGILTHRDVRFVPRSERPVRELMTAERLITVREGVEPRRGHGAAARASDREAAGGRRRLPAGRADHGQGHREGAALPQRLQGRAGPAARRCRHGHRRGRARAGRGADRGRRRRDRGRYRARPFQAACSTAWPRSGGCPTPPRSSPATSPPATRRQPWSRPAPTRSRSASGRARSAPRGSSPASACRS